MIMNKCPKCGGAEIDRGWITSAGKVAYLSDKQRGPFVKANCTTYVCVNCGYAETYVDPNYLKKARE